MCQVVFWSVIPLSPGWSLRLRIPTGQSAGDRQVREVSRNTGATTACKRPAPSHGHLIERVCCVWICVNGVELATSGSSEAPSRSSERTGFSHSSTSTDLGHRLRSELCLCAFGCVFIYQNKIESRAKNEMTVEDRSFSYLLLTGAPAWTWPSHSLGSLLCALTTDRSFSVVKSKFTLDWKALISSRTFHWQHYDPDDRPMYVRKSASSAGQLIHLRALHSFISPVRPFYLITLLHMCELALVANWLFHRVCGSIAFLNLCLHYIYSLALTARCVRGDRCHLRSQLRLN